MTSKKTVSPRKKRNPDVYLQSERRTFITNITLSSIITVFSLACLISLLLPQEQPPAEALPYRNYTFVSYERIASGGRHRSYHYEITVEESEDPLVIDNIVQNKVDRKQLDALQAGNTLTASVRLDSRGNQKLVFLSHGNDPLLPYEVYLREHTTNNTVGIVVCSCFTVLGIGMIIGSPLLYRANLRRYQRGRNRKKRRNR